MFLQYGIEDNTLSGSPDDVESINFCISCGSHELTEKRRQLVTLVPRGMSVISASISLYIIIIILVIQG